MKILKPCPYNLMIFDKIYTYLMKIVEKFMFMPKELSFH